MNEKKTARILIEIPEELKKALKARLALQGLTLKQWFIERALETVKRKR